MSADSGIPFEARTLRSVGAHLALATAIVMVVASLAIYLALTRHERESLLDAKSRAAEMVCSLFAEALSAPLVFGDDQGIEESLTYLKSNTEIEQAAVFSLDAQGKPTETVSELRQRPGLPALSAPAVDAVGRLQMADTSLSVSRWVRDTEGKAIGAATVRFSLARERARYELLARRIQQVAAAIAAGLTLLLLLLARLYIIAPLAALRRAASRLQGGAKPDDPALARLPLAAQDELGDLARAFVSMAQAIERREQAIASQNDEMRLVLESVGQGFLVLAADGTLLGQHSAVVARWFGPLAPGRPLWEYLRGQDMQQAEWLELAWSNIGAPFMPLELCVEQMPKRFEAHGRSYDFEYRPSCDQQGQLLRMVVIISDVSELTARERAEREQRELAGVLGSIAADRAGFMGFFEEAAATLARLGAPGARTPSQLLQDLHTLKGNAGLFQLRKLAQLCEELELRLASEQRPPSEQDVEPLRRCFAVTAALVERVTGHGAEHELTLTVGEYDAIAESLRRGAPAQAVLEQLARATAEPAERVFSRLARRLQGLARNLGKAEVDVDVQGHGLRFAKARYAPLWAALVHALRNTADHGLETALERESAGKSPTASVTLSSELEAGKLVIRVIDDGRGVDLARVRARAQEQGLRAEDDNELLELLFEPGFSTAQDDNALSGRGVGLSAVRSAVAALGGTVTMFSRPGQGSELRVELPAGG